MIPSSQKSTIITNNRFLGIAMFCVAFVIVFAMLHHPEGNYDPSSEDPKMQWVHGILIFLVILNTYAVGHFLTQIEEARREMKLGNIFYNVGVGAFIGAALISGFVQTELAEIYQYQGTDQKLYRTLNQYASIENQSFAKLGIMAYGAAGIFWFLPMFKLGGSIRCVGFCGLCAGIGLGASVLTGITLSVLSMTILTIVIVMWHCSIAIWLLKN